MITLTRNLTVGDTTLSVPIMHPYMAEIAGGKLVHK